MRFASWRPHSDRDFRGVNANYLWWLLLKLTMDRKHFTPEHIHTVGAD